MMRQLWAVLRKETLDHLRDRRSMFSALLMPLVGPALFAGLFTVIASWNREDKPLLVHVAGAQNAPNLVAFLERNGASIREAPPDFEARVRDGEAPLIWRALRRADHGRRDDHRPAGSRDRARVAGRSHAVLCRRHRARRAVSGLCRR